MEVIYNPCIIVTNLRENFKSNFFVAALQISYVLSYHNKSSNGQLEILDVLVFS